MHVFIVSDIHLQQSNYSDVRSALKGIVEHVNTEIHPDHVVMLGDLIEHGQSAEEDIYHLKEVKEICDGFSYNTTYLIGNHDIRNVDKQTVKEIFDQKLWGRIADTNMIYLDSTSERFQDARGEVSNRQLKFLDQELSQLDGCILFVHHPIHYHSMESNYWFNDKPELAFCGNKDRVNDLLMQHDNIMGVFNGHLHEVDYTRYRGNHHFTINAFAKVLPDSGIAGTFAELEVKDGVHVRIVERDGIEENGIERIIKVPIKG